MSFLTLTPSSQESIITPGIYRDYRQMIEYTMCDLEEAKEFGDLPPSETDREDFLRICVDSVTSSESFQQKTIKNAMMQPGEMVLFCSPEEAFNRVFDWERKLERCFYSFKQKFEEAVERITSSLSIKDVIKHFEDLKRRGDNQQRFVVIGKDLTDHTHIIDLCGVLLFYDIKIQDHELELQVLEVCR
jgi:hypothetical protein